MDTDRPKKAGRAGHGGTPLGEKSMKQIQPIINVLFGVAAAILIGRFFDIGGNPIYAISGELIIGVIAGVWSTIKIKSIKTNKTISFGNVIFINVSLWFGIAAGLLAGVLIIYVLVFVVLSQIFGHPESKVWPHAATLTVEILLVLVSLLSMTLLGNWFIKNSLNFVEKKLGDESMKQRQNT
jgi:hypothetical protein